MKSLFYGGAVAAVSGLLLGAGMKTPLAVEDFEPMAEVVGLETAEAPGYDTAPRYAAPAYYAPVVQVQHSPAPYEKTEAEAELTPAVYTVDSGEDASGAAQIYELAGAEPDEAPLNVLQPTDDIEAPEVVGRSQGFQMVGAPAADMF